MLGEELSASEVTERGLLGDRAYALVDSADGKAATAKNPRKWPTLFGFSATYIEPPHIGASVPPVRITLPDGTAITSQQANINQVLSRAPARCSRPPNRSPTERNSFCVRVASSSSELIGLSTMMIPA